MKITSKGQLTIPQQVRHQANMPPGSEVEVVFENDQVVVKKLSVPDIGQEIVNRLKGSGKVNMSTDEIMALTRGDH